MSIIRTHNCFL